MRRVAVESETIASIGYDPSWNVLEIEFKDTGDVYLYYGVSQAEYDAFMSAPSKGTYLNQQFKKAGYRYEKISPQANN